MNGYLTLNDLAERWGINYDALVLRRHRGQLPLPDEVKSRVPMWTVATIEEYEQSVGGEVGPFTPTQRRRNDKGVFEREINGDQD